MYFLESEEGPGGSQSSDSIQRVASCLAAFKRKIGCGSIQLNPLYGKKGIVYTNASKCLKHFTCSCSKGAMSQYFKSFSDYFK